jgi:ribitol-5-phosphate 2-dehydrogenase
MINTLYRLVSPKHIEIYYEELDLSDEAVLVRPTYLSICKADQRYYQGTREPEILEKKLPMALIHEGIGEVVYDGTGSFTPGEVVAMIPNTPTEVVDTIGENYLPTSKFRSSGFDGYLQDYVAFNPNRLVKIEADLNPLVASFTELVSVSVHSILRMDQFAHQGKDVLGVWGDGTVGYITALLLKIFYPQARVLVFGKNHDKLSYFTFADEAYLVSEVPPDVVVDQAFECVGGQKSQLAIEQIIRRIQPEGTISLLGVSEYPVPINTRMILEKGLRIYGSSRSSREDFEKSIEILETYPEVTDYLENLVVAVIRVRTIKDIHHAFERDYQLNFGKTVLIWDK